jgi:hypothetical protein
VDGSGNQVTVLGDGNNSSPAAGGSDGESTPSAGNTTDGGQGTGSGNQTGPAVSAPVDGSGNQVTVLGDGNTTSRDETDPSGSDVDPGQSGDVTDEPGTDASDASDTPSAVNGSDGSASGGDALVTSSGAQGGPAVPAAVLLPQTGAAGGLLGTGLTGMAILLLGLALTLTGRRRTDGPGRGHEDWLVA